MNRWYGPASGDCSCCEEGDVCCGEPKILITDENISLELIPSAITNLQVFHPVEIQPGIWDRQLLATQNGPAVLAPGFPPCTVTVPLDNGETALITLNENPPGPVNYVGYWYGEYTTIQVVANTPTETGTQTLDNVDQNTSPANLWRITFDYAGQEDECQGPVCCNPYEWTNSGASVGGPISTAEFFFQLDPGPYDRIYRMSAINPDPNSPYGCDWIIQTIQEDDTQGPDIPVSYLNGRWTFFWEVVYGIGGEPRYPTRDTVVGNASFGAYAEDVLGDRRVMVQYTVVDMALCFTETQSCCDWSHPDDPALDCLHVAGSRVDIQGDFSVIGFGQITAGLTYNGTCVYRGNASDSLSGKNYQIQAFPIQYNTGAPDFFDLWNWRFTMLSYGTDPDDTTAPGFFETDNNRTRPPCNGTFTVSVNATAQLDVTGVTEGCPVTVSALLKKAQPQWFGDHCTCDDAAMLLDVYGPSQRERLAREIRKGIRKRKKVPVPELQTIRDEIQKAVDKYERDS